MTIQSSRPVGPDSTTGRVSGLPDCPGTEDDHPDGTRVSLVRSFASGATRDRDDGKHDFEGFLSPRALRRYGEYMHKHRTQSDGELRGSDNWQRGMPTDAYMKSGWRHFMDWWTLHRGVPCEDFHGNPVDLEDAVCAVLFNAFGYLHELLKENDA